MALPRKPKWPQYLWLLAGLLLSGLLFFKSLGG